MHQGNIAQRTWDARSQQGAERRRSKASGFRFLRQAQRDEGAQQARQRGTVRAGLHRQRLNAHRVLRHEIGEAKCGRHKDHLRRHITEDQLAEIGRVIRCDTGHRLLLLGDAPNDKTF